MVEVLLITRNRAAFLKRSLDYYAAVSFSIPIVVADSSDSEQAESVRLVVAQYVGRLNVRLVSFPASEPPFYKMARAANGMVSNYIAVVGDDDFLLQESVLKCADFLDKNPEYCVADGREVRFLIDEDGGFDSYVLPQLDIEHSVPHHRVQAHLERYWPTFYGVHRKANLIRFSTAAGALALPGIFADSVIPELYLSCLIVAAGKYKFLDGLHIVRQNEHRASTHYCSWDTLVELPEFRMVMEGFRTDVSSVCLEYGAKSRIASDDAFNVGFNSFMAFFMPSDAGAVVFMPRPSLLERLDIMRGMIFRWFDYPQKKIFKRVVLTLSGLRNVNLRGALMGGAAQVGAVSDAMHEPSSSRYFTREQFSSDENQFAPDLNVIAEYIKCYPFGRE